MGKQSSYQKLKSEIAQLRADLFELALNPNSLNSEVIRGQIKFRDLANRATLLGEANESPSETKGLMAWVRERGEVVTIK